MLVGSQGVIFSAPWCTASPARREGISWAPQTECGDSSNWLGRPETRGETAETSRVLKNVAYFVTPKKIEQWKKHIISYIYILEHMI